MTIDVVKHKHLILPLVLIALLFAACEKSSDQPDKETFETYPEWVDDPNNSFWNKQTADCVAIDNEQDGDTTIQF